MHVRYWMCIRHSWLAIDSGVVIWGRVYVKGSSLWGCEGGLRRTVCGVGGRVVTWYYVQRCTVSESCMSHIAVVSVTADSTVAVGEIADRTCQSYCTNYNP